MKTDFQCRSCGGTDGELLLDLGKQPPANRLLTDSGEAEPLVPLRLALCRTCYLVQITDLVPPKELFSDYVYFSSFSETWVRHCKAAAGKHMAEFKLAADSFVVEVASNDGCLLRHFRDAGIKHLGVEPAGNIAAAARENGIKTVEKFFGEDTARAIREERGAANIILANNVFAHAPDINDFTRGLATLLAKDGVAVLEFPHAVEMIDKVEFDTIYHEHVFYFTLSALQPLLARHGMTAWRVERLAMHGGSLRLYLCREGARAIEDSVGELLNDEAARGVGGPTFYREFAGRVESIRTELQTAVAQWKSNGEVAAYGAAAKGSTLLNYCGLGSESIAFAVDRSPHKQGKFMPGVRVPILPVESLAVRQPVAAVLLAWNFTEEILAQQSAYREAGGKFIIPIPEVRVV